MINRKLPAKILAPEERDAPDPPPSFADYRKLGALRPECDPAERPLVTIVTAVRNGAGMIARTIDSVQTQNCPGIEHVVIDGASTDATPEILSRLLRAQDYWISEPDQGISDAFNKGVTLARGAFIQFLGADDWLSPLQIGRALDTLQRTGADFVFGDLLFHEGAQPSFRYVGERNYAAALARRMPAMNHPTVLARRECFERVGLFSLRWRCAMEYDWFLRLHATGARGKYDSGILGNMTYEGVSNRQFKRTIEEVRQIAVAHGRMAALAKLEARARVARIRASHLLRERSELLYRLGRRAINPSYRPIRWNQ
jgi:glycosyltransferase involved in cell wall biosynthesis